MYTKSIKLFFHKPLNADWEELNTRLNKLSWQTAKIMNFGMTQWWLYQYNKDKWKNENGKYPKKDELSDPYPFIKKYIKENCNYFPTYSNSAITQFLKNKWGNSKKGECREVFYTQTRSLTTFKKGFPILCTNQQYKIEKVKGCGYVLTVTLADKSYKEVMEELYPNERKRSYPGQFKIQLKTKNINKSIRSVLDRMISGEYKNGELKIKKDKKKGWCAIFSYSFEKEEFSLDPGTICGIDLGLVYSFVCALNNSSSRLYGTDGGEIEHFRKQIQNRRRKLQKQGPFSTRVGKGRKEMLSPTLLLQKNVDNFRDTKYHTYTKKIIDFCLQNKAGVIQLENIEQLSGVKGNNFLLSDWALFDFKTKLMNKAEEVGIDVIEVNPRYTSKRCSDCGYINERNRIGQPKFRCLKCGHEDNADYNAAKNISTLDIENLVNEELGKQNTLP